MSVMAKPVNLLPPISQNNKKEFISEFNKNVVSDEFLKSCKKAASLFTFKK